MHFIVLFMPFMEWTDGSFEPKNPGHPERALTKKSPAR